MTLEELGSIGEFIAAIGLIVSLIFVGLEVRKTRKQNMVEGTENRLSAWNEWGQLLLTNPDLREIFLRGSKDIGELNEDERFAFNQLMIFQFTILVRMYVRGTELGDEEALSGARGSLEDLFRLQRSGAVWWKRHRTGWREPFRAFVDDIVEEQERLKR